MEPVSSAAIQLKGSAALSDLAPETLATLVSDLDDAIAESRSTVHPVIAAFGFSQVLFGAISIARGSSVAGWVMAIAGCAQVVLFWLSAVSSVEQTRSLESVLQRSEARRLRRAVVRARRIILRPESRRAAAESLKPRKEMLLEAVEQQLAQLR
jgi:hypothetical protein